MFNLSTTWVGRRSVAGVRALAVGVAVVAIIAVGVGRCGDDSATAFNVRVGDCLLEPSELTFLDVDEVPCEESHVYEVFALVDYPASPDALYPGVGDVLRHLSNDSDLNDSGGWEEWGFEACLPHFEPYVDQKYEYSRLELAIFYPTLESWEAGDREFACLLFDLYDTSMTGSMRGSGF